MGVWVIVFKRLCLCLGSCVCVGGGHMSVSRGTLSLLRASAHREIVGQFGVGR